MRELVTTYDNITKHFKGIRVEFKGSDACDFLQRLCCQDVLSVKKDPKLAAFLDKRARVISPFYLIKNENYCLIVSDLFKGAMLSYIDKMHFGEDISLNIEDIVWTEECYRHNPTEASSYELYDWHLWGTAFKVVFYWDVVGNDMKKEFEALSYIALAPGIDNAVFKNIMILDGPFDHFISRQKGCYPGQEVVEKIHHNKRPKQMFVCHVDALANEDLSLIKQGKKIGVALSCIPALQDKGSLALAIVRCNKCSSGEVLQTDLGLDVSIY